MTTRERTKIIVLVLQAFITIAASENHLLIDKLRTDFMNLEETLWKYVLWEAPHLSPVTAEDQCIRKFYEFDKRLVQMPEDILRGLEPVRHIHAFLFLYAELKHTEVLYEKFRQFLASEMASSTDEKHHRPDTFIGLEDAIRDILDAKTGANATVHKVYNLTFGNENMALEIFHLISKDYYCKNYAQSPDQIYYNLYNAIALGGLKNYVMVQFAYLISRISDKGNYTDLSEITRVMFEKRVNETMSVFRGSMEIVPKTTWKCDPKEHVLGRTCEQFTRLVQGHIQNEVDMNLDGTCRENCEAYPVATSYGCYDSDSKYCREMERCGGNIYDCRFVDSHMKICPSNQSFRRYDYIEYDSGRIMGKTASCWKKTIKSWWRWFVHCSYCVCLCDEQSSKSDRFVNLRPVLANVQRNRVVTGLRFVKHNRILHLQIQEGKLLPYGYVDNRTIRWVPVDNYTITDKGVYNEKDYFTMTYDNRSMALDDVEMDQENYVVTGVRFQFVTGKLRFQIHVNAFDWRTGVLSQRISNYIYKVNGGKNKIDLANADVPLHAPPSEMNYNSDLFVEFTHTGFDKDAAQTTIPFLDTQPVTNVPEVPLKGAGLYYKGKPGYGGFVAPKIISYDFSKYFLVRFPKLETLTESDVISN